MGKSVSLHWVSRKLPQDLEYKTLTSSWFDMGVQKFCVLALVAMAWNGIHAGCPRPPYWCSPDKNATFALRDCDGDGVPDPICLDINGNFGVISSADDCIDSWPEGRCVSGNGGDGDDGDGGNGSSKCKDLEDKLAELNAKLDNANICPIPGNGGDGDMGAMGVMN